MERLATAFDVPVVDSPSLVHEVVTRPPVPLLHVVRGVAVERAHGVAVAERVAAAAFALAGARAARRAGLAGRRRGPRLPLIRLGAARLRLALPGLLLTGWAVPRLLAGRRLLALRLLRLL